MNASIFDGLYNRKWYNGDNLTEKQYGYVLFENKIVGQPRLRQLRVSVFFNHLKIFSFLF
jgi:hypothetical protein